MPTILAQTSDSSRTMGRVLWTTRVRVAGIVALVLLAGIVWWLRSGDPATPPERPAAAPPASAPAPAPTPPPRDPCTRPAPRGFAPTALSVPGVVRRAEVRGIPRDAHGVPGVPPVAEKSVVAWDLGGVEPGSDRGHVLLNAHTWPDGTALGNRLLDGLRRGGRLVLHGAGGAVACYRVVERTEVRVEDGYPGWDAEEGSPEVVLVVCSGVRRGPGDWSHRTLWFARPLT